MRKMQQKKYFNRGYKPTENRERHEAKLLANELYMAPFYRYLKAEKKNNTFKSKFHRKAYNHLTKSIQRLNEIAMEDFR